MNYLRFNIQLHYLMAGFVEEIVPCPLVLSKLYWMNCFHLYSSEEQGSGPLVGLGVMQYGDQLVSCRWDIIEHTLLAPQSIFSQQQEACRRLTRGLTLTRFTHSKQTAHCTPIPHLAGEERKKTHIVDSRNMMGLVSFPGVVFVSFCYSSSTLYGP